MLVETFNALYVMISLVFLIRYFVDGIPGSFIGNAAVRFAANVVLLSTPLIMFLLGSLGLYAYFITKVPVRERPLNSQIFILTLYFLILLLGIAHNVVCEIARKSEFWDLYRTRDIKNKKK